MRDPLRDCQPCGIVTAVTPRVTENVTGVTVGVTQGHVWLNHASRSRSRLPLRGRMAMKSAATVDLEQTAGTLEEESA
jgi:hypothetical protein